MNQFSLEGRVALVSGASRGFGRAIAELYAAAGADLVVTYRQEEDGCRALAEEITRKGRRGVAIHLDVTSPSSVATAVARTMEEFGRIDVLVNNAGLMHLERFTDSSPESWRADIDVNVYGVLNVTHAIVPVMIDRQYGKIINLSSQLALAGWERAPVYAGTKGFVLVWTKSLAKELGMYNINVNAIGPGSIITDMNADVYPDEESRRARMATLPLRRFGSPQDVATCALFLAAPASDFMTGQMLGPNGGGAM